MKPSTEKAMALLSSGLDSAVSMAWIHSEGSKIQTALTFDYGQRAKSQEIQHAHSICNFYGIRHEVITLPWFSTFESKGLLSTTEKLAQPNLETLNHPVASLKSAAQVWVPNRNGVFLEVAASIAESRNINRIIVGFNAEEAVTFPDNSASYLNAINKSLALSTANQVKIESPTLQMNKNEIVALGNSLMFPFHLLWSCYEANDTMCGSCESCMRLKRALIQNGNSIDGLFINTTLN
ncbi:MAG: 7-cyano-7-deazaguanine synthase QueC [Deltaproteobacteria bacterium]